MKFLKNQRGFILIEFVITLPLLILLLYSLGTLTLTTARIAREQVADYVLETEAQEVIDRITGDARAAYSVKIESGGYSLDSQNNFEKIIFMCDSLTATKEREDVEYYKEILDPKIYAVHAAQGGIFHVYFKRKNDTNFNNPITGENSFGNTFVTQMKFSVPAPKLLHITFEMQSKVTEQKVKFSTAVYMPNCEEIIFD